MCSSASDIQKRVDVRGGSVGACLSETLERGHELCITNVQRYSLHDGGGIRTVDRKSVV